MQWTKPDMNTENRRHPMETVRNIAVSINIGGASGRDCLSGIFKYVNAGRNWNLHLANTPEDLVKIISSGGKMIDGIIMGYSAVEDARRNISSFPVPVVFTDLPEDVLPSRCGKSPTVFVCNDDESVGELAAQHFTGRGNFKSFAYVVGAKASRWSRHRESGFRKQLAKHGLECRTYRNAISGNMLAPFAKWLLKLKFPAAALASSDIVATQVIEAAKHAKISIPDQLSVIGVDNDELLCNNTSPTLSSIQPDHEKLGFTAATELDRLIGGGRVRTNAVRIKPIRKIFERGSTRQGPPAAHIIDRAMALIDLKFATVTVDAVVNHLKVSRRLAYLRFRQILNTSIHQAIMNRRLQEAKRMLQRTKLPISKIAATCGFASQNRFTHAFRKHTGMSPTQWRNDLHVPFSDKIKSRPACIRCGTDTSQFRPFP